MPISESPTKLWGENAKKKFDQIFGKRHDKQSQQTTMVSIFLCLRFSPAYSSRSHPIMFMTTKTPPRTGRSAHEHIGFFTSFHVIRPPPPSLDTTIVVDHHDYCEKCSYTGTPSFASSPKTQPKLHKSIAVVYLFSPSKTSGDRYHSVTTSCV